MKITLGLPEISLGVIILGILQFLSSLWISERFKASIQKENAIFLEKLKWETKVREQASRVAEYMSIAIFLKETDSPEKYQQANQLSWELAMWLPDSVYKTMTKAIANPDSKVNALSVVVDIRKLLLGDDFGNLHQDELIFHAPGAGNKNRLTP